MKLLSTHPWAPGLLLSWLLVSGASAGQSGNSASDPNTIPHDSSPGDTGTCVFEPSPQPDLRSDQAVIAELLAGEAQDPESEGPERQKQTMDRLEQWLGETAESRQAADRVLRNHARVGLAAHHVRAGDYQRARHVLAEVKLDSPVAVRASLLIAESWRLEGNQEASRGWIKRIARRYSASPLALEGLMLMASDMEASDPARARSVYNLVMRRVLDNLDQLAELVEQDEAMMDTLLSTRLDESREVASELMRAFLTDPSRQSMEALERVVKARTSLDCIARREESIREKAMKASEQRTNIGAFETSIRREKDQLRAELSELRNSANGSSAKIERLESQLASLERRHRELREKSQGVPDDSLARRRALREAREEMRAVIQENRARVVEDLRQVALSLQNHYRNLAGESQLSRTDLLQRVTRRGQP